MAGATTLSWVGENLFIFKDGRRFGGGARASACSASSTASTRVFAFDINDLPQNCACSVEQNYDAVMSQLTPSFANNSLISPGSYRTFLSQGRGIGAGDEIAHGGGRALQTRGSSASSPHRARSTGGRRRAFLPAPRAARRPAPTARTPASARNRDARSGKRAGQAAGASRPVATAAGRVRSARTGPFRHERRAARDRHPPPPAPAPAEAAPARRAPRRR